MIDVTLSGEEARTRMPDPKPVMGNHAADTIDGDGLLPPHVRRVAFGVVGVAMVFATYLFIVRGPALLLDLAHTAASLFCL